ncbi:MAG: helicase-related protein, partial [Patescibacteria group bacterium]
QAAFLAPTTILAMQHARTFEERLRRTAIETRLLSRVVSKKEQKKTIEGLKKGIIDCVIGTHRLFSKDISFKNLGLVIIDEEQRFGVKHKEHFKEIRAELDVLSLSATPIPRTLSLALARLRDMSVLETPPPERKPIHTFVLPYSEKMIKEAIRAELSRGGQIYFLHNRIETIGRARKKLENLLARAGSERAPKIGIIHGRMDERELVRTMDRFREKEIDILLATTIIENGLDISSANTLIVDDATRLGLAQAHQLRGRIGRGRDEAFAYFLYKPKHLTEKSLDRLEALKEYAELGSGYSIALRDLEIRGAGNILGKEQAGAINKVGLNLYCQMLSETIETLKETRK